LDYVFETDTIVGMMAWHLVVGTVDIWVVICGKFFGWIKRLDGIFLEELFVDSGKRERELVEFSSRLGGVLDRWRLGGYLVNWFSFDWLRIEGTGLGQTVSVWSEKGIVVTGVDSLRPRNGFSFVEYASADCVFNCKAGFIKGLEIGGGLKDHQMFGKVRFQIPSDNPHLFFL
jgi:hypothetical protein